jgi:hypothetical protein
LRISFFTGFGNTKTWTLGEVLTQSVTNLGPWDHQGKKATFVRTITVGIISNHRRSPAISSSASLRSWRKEEIQTDHYHLFARLARFVPAAYILCSPWGAAGNGG